MSSTNLDPPKHYHPWLPYPTFNTTFGKWRIAPIIGMLSGLIGLIHARVCNALELISSTVVPKSYATYFIPNYNLSFSIHVSL